MIAAAMCTRKNLLRVCLALLKSCKVLILIDLRGIQKQKPTEDVRGTDEGTKDASN